MIQSLSVCLSYNIFEINIIFCFSILVGSNICFRMLVTNKACSVNLQLGLDGWFPPHFLKQRKHFYPNLSLIHIQVIKHSLILCHFVSGWHQPAFFLRIFCSQSPNDDYSNLLWSQTTHSFRPSVKLLSQQLDANMILYFSMLFLRNWCLHGRN